jgi:hypothetical protein
MGRWADFGRITANVSSFPSKAFDLKAILKVFFHRYVKDQNGSVVGDQSTHDCRFKGSNPALAQGE